MSPVWIPVALAAAGLLGVVAGAVAGFGVNVSRAMRAILENHGVNRCSVMLLTRAVPLLRRLHGYGELGMAIPDSDTRLVEAWLADHEQARDLAEKERARERARRAR